MNSPHVVPLYPGRKTMTSPPFEPATHQLAFRPACRQHDTPGVLGSGGESRYDSTHVVSTVALVVNKIWAITDAVVCSHLGSQPQYRRSTCAGAVYRGSDAGCRVVCLQFQVTPAVATVDQR